MQSDPESPFELLDPPSGGVARMRARLAAPEPVRGGFRLAVAGVAALAAFFALLAVISNERRGSDAGNAILAAPEFDRLLGREGTQHPPLPLTVERDGRAVPTEELPSSDPRVRIYRML